MKTELYTGINIQWPISESILKGKKTVETRVYPFPPRYVGVPLVFIETPGPHGRFRSRAVALITFNTSFPYGSKSVFYADEAQHLVNKNSPWAWKDGKKFGWPIKKVVNFKSPIEINQRKGIIFTTNLHLILRL